MHFSFPVYSMKCEIHLIYGSKFFVKRNGPDATPVIESTINQNPVGSSGWAWFIAGNDQRLAATLLRTGWNSWNDLFGGCLAVA
jgi:hypothetical protein